MSASGELMQAAEGGRQPAPYLVVAERTRFWSLSRTRSFGFDRLPLPAGECPHPNRPNRSSRVAFHLPRTRFFFTFATDWNITISESIARGFTPPLQGTFSSFAWQRFGVQYLVLGFRGAPGLGTVEAVALWPYVRDRRVQGFFVEGSVRASSSTFHPISANQKGLATL